MIGLCIQTYRLMGGIYEYAIEMGSGAKFHKDRSRHSEVDRGDTHTDGMEIA
jgi:hypothetical protein